MCRGTARTPALRRAEVSHQVIGRINLPNLTILPILTADDSERAIRGIAGTAKRAIQANAEGAVHLRASRQLAPTRLAACVAFFDSAYACSMWGGVLEQANSMYQGGDTTQFQRLLDGWAAGDDAARTELLERAAQRLLELTRRMFRNYPQLRRWEETDDVFQNAILRLYRSLGDVRPDSVRGFFALAATQIRRTLIDLARHHFGPEGSAARHHSDVGRSDASAAQDRLATGRRRRAARNARRLGPLPRSRRAAPAPTSATPSA